MIEARRGEANVTANTRWMTYQEMADHLGMKVDSARRHAQREGWPRLPGNDGKARVGVPGDVAAQGDVSGAANGGDDHPGEVAALREALARERERAAQAEGERDALQEALQAAKATAEDAGRRARIAEEQAAVAHQRAAKVAAVLGRVADGLEQIQRNQAIAAETVAADKADRQAAEARQRAEAAEVRVREFEQLADPANTSEEAARQVKLANERAEEADRRAAMANAQLERFQQDRVAQARILDWRAAAAAAEIEAEARRPWWRRLGRRR